MAEARVKSSGGAYDRTRRELVAQLLKKEGIALPGTSRLTEQLHDESALSYAQERLWFLDQLHPGSAVYNIARALRLRGRLNREALAEGINAIVRRHEILRAFFPCVNDQPVQRITSSLTLPLPVIDLSGRARSKRAAEMARVLSAEAGAPFDLARGPLLRAQLIKLAKEDHVLLVVLHQMVCDGWSMTLLLRELAILYRSLVKGQASALPQLPIQYAGYAARQRQSFRRDALQKQLAYWKDRLHHSSADLALPTDHPRPGVQTFRGARFPLAIPKALTRRLKTLGAEVGATPFMALMAVFNVLLWRYSSQDDISVGFAAANRQQSDAENLIGLFVNTMVLRTEFSGNPTFRELLRRVRAHCRDALARQDLPFDKLVEELHGERDLSRNPLFQAMFVYQNYPAAEFTVPGLRVEPLDLPGSTAKFDLTLSLIERGSDLRGFFEYSSDLFEAPTIERMARHFVTLISGIVSHPDKSVAELPLLSKREREQILIEWNRTAASYPKNRCVHELFEAQVMRTPHAIAVECNGESLSYRELNRRANQLTHYLRTLGIGPNKMVGICLRRSLDMVIGVLGILKAGGAYLPLDPAYPRERLQFMLDDAGASVLVSQKSLAEDGRWRIEDGHSRLRVVCLDRDAVVIARQISKNPKIRIGSERLAYVIYTSGSTGQPKGVAIEHRNATAFLHWAKRVFSANELAGVLASTSICFDLSVFELFAPLCSGGKVILVEDMLALHGFPHAAGVTLINTVPSAIGELLDLGPVPPSVRTVNLAGEPLKTELVKRIYETGKVEKVHDLYGPSETTTYSTFTLRGKEGKATIGRPIANTKIYLLDGALQPVPVGVPGEIFIGGAGVARGYLNRPELTAEKFLRDPFASSRNARMYRTGDLARYHPDGNIEYLGRLDQQVKIRGYRIELGEIEAALHLHPAVRESVVVAREFVEDGKLSSNPKTPIQNSKFDRRLVAYIIFNKSAAPSHAELRSFLREKLPEYMVPAIFIRLEALPLTANGKVDRHALPAPYDGSAPLTDDFTAPRTEVEELIAQVWRAVLKTERISVHDNFFDLGGHSLLAIRVAARLRSSFDIELPLRKLFELPTVAQLAPQIESLRRGRSALTLPPIVAAPRDEPIPLSFAQRRVWFLHKLNTELTAYNMPTGYRVKGPLNIPALETALNQMIRRHESLRTAIAEIDGEPVQRIDPTARLELSIIDLTPLRAEQAEKEVARILNDDARQPFDFTVAPLMRAKLLKLDAADHVLISNFHHLIADGSSLVIFYRELAALYEGALVGKHVVMPALAVQYSDFAAWQRDWLETGAAARQLSYWKQQLGTDPRRLELPTDYARPSLQSYRGAKVSRRLSQDLTGALKRLSRQQGATLFMTLLAALKILLARVAGQDDVVVGSTVAGRNRAELDGLIGFFINALALRTDLSGNPTFLEVLKRVREVCLDAYTHQDLPFERIVEELNPQRDPDRNPIFQVLFNMADVSERTLKLAGGETVSLSQAAPGAKFDLVLRAPEIDGCVELELLYNADLFSEGRMAALLEQWSSLLSQAVGEPTNKIDQFSLVTATARAGLPDPTAPLDKTWRGPIHSLISGQADAQGEKIAIADSQEKWRYRELDEMSNRLANLLITSGVKLGEVIAIYAQRDASLALAILAVLKAGAVFAILDPAYPAARLIEYLRIAQPTGWIQMSNAELPPELTLFLETLKNFSRVDLPRDKVEIARRLDDYPAAAPLVDIAADDPAYIAFTSGSTGQPKGVLCRHGPITHFLPWQEQAFDLRVTDRYSLLSGLGYNHLQRELFTALASGAIVCIPAAELMKDAVQLGEWLRQQEISILHLTPALGRLLRLAKGKTLPAVRRIFFGGDLLTGQDVAATRELAPKAAISNFYGATETQRAVGYFVVTEPSSLETVMNREKVPTGKGVKDTQLLVLTSNGQLAGLGELGEIYVRSPHLAAGYIGDDRLTRAKFVTNPFTRDHRDRLYRTSELGRYLPDGTVEWAGRRGRRISIRGFRVELAEVESALSQCAGVRHAAVIAREFDHGDGAAATETRMVAYVEREKDCVLDGVVLREFLKARLAHYMIPAYFHFMDRLPINPNGKIDYFSLPAVADFDRPSDAPFEPPQGSIEQTLGGIFAAVLGVKRVGRHDNFFDLGGHSLLAAQAAARIRETLGAGLDLRVFLQAPTVAALAQRVEDARISTGAKSMTETDEREEIEI